MTSLPYGMWPGLNIYVNLIMCTCSPLLALFLMYYAGQGECYKCPNNFLNTREKKSRGDLNSCGRHLSCDGKATSVGTSNGYFGVHTMNVVNSIVRIPIKEYIGLLTLTILNSNVRRPIQSSAAEKLTYQLLEPQWRALPCVKSVVFAWYSGFLHH